MKAKIVMLAAALALTLVGAAPAQISGGVVKIGVLTDMSGAYSDLGGPGSVIAIQMALDDFLEQEKPAFKVEMVYADHQNKADIAASKAREWYERSAVAIFRGSQCPMMM